MPRHESKLPGWALRWEAIPDTASCGYALTNAAPLGNHERGKWKCIADAVVPETRSPPFAFLHASGAFSNAIVTAKHLPTAVARANYNYTLILRKIQHLKSQSGRQKVPLVEYGNERRTSNKYEKRRCAAAGDPRRAQRQRSGGNRRLPVRGGERGQQWRRRRDLCRQRRQSQ